MTDTDTNPYTTEHEREAYRMGVAAAQASASWAADGNTTNEHRRRVLAMLEDGDPAAYDHLPAEPDLSGQWADAPTPSRLAGQIIGYDNAAAMAEHVDAIADAWEAGVADTFERECERILRAAL